VYFVSISTGEEDNPIKLMGFIKLPTVIYEIQWIEAPKPPLNKCGVIALTEKALLISAGIEEELIEFSEVEREDYLKEMGVDLW